MFSECVLVWYMYLYSAKIVCTANYYFAMCCNVILSLFLCIAVLCICVYRIVCDICIT